MNEQGATRYTVYEIDAMRAALALIAGDSVPPATVEDRLRTYMLNGTSLGELQAHLAEWQKDQAAAYAAKKAKRRAFVQRYDLRATFLGEKRLSKRDEQDLILLGRFLIHPSDFYTSGWMP